MPDISITPGAGGLCVSTPYDADFLAEFKANVPHAARSWQKPYWVIDPAYGLHVASLISKHYGVQVNLPIATTAPAPTETRSFELRYLGRCKERGDGVSSAMGTSDGRSWPYVFSETVLRGFFGSQAPQPDRQPSLYEILATPNHSDSAAIKSAYRRMARQWHPDVCKEPDANEQFQRIQHAYNILRDEQTRKRYDAGLVLEASFQSTERGAARWDNAASVEYRAPLRCGFLLATGQVSIGRFIVSKILDWQDIVDSRGRTLVSSWDIDNDCIKMEWI